MQIGMVGLGRMGANIVRRLNKAGGFSAVVYDANAAAVGSLAAEGATGAGSLADFVATARNTAHGVGDAAGGQGHRGDDRRAR